MTPFQRIYYLDTLRGFLMSMGVFLHSGIIVSSLALPATVSFLSGLFRMKLFFLVSGYFTGLVASKDRDNLVKGRLKRVVVPGLFAFIFLNQVTNYFLYITRVEYVSAVSFFKPSFQYASNAPDYLNSHLHVWFLFALTAYFLILPMLLSVCRKVAGSKAVASLLNLSPTFGLFVAGCIMTAALVVARTAHYLLFQHYLKGTDLNYPVQGTLMYLPYFALGLIAFLNPRVFALLHKVNVFHAIAAAAVLGASVLVYSRLFALGGLPLAEMSEHIGRGFSGFFLACVLLRVFAAVFEHKSTFGSVLARTSYTVFILHFLVIAVTQYALISAGISGYLLYVTTIFATLAICIAFHYWVVENFRTAGFLVNGKDLRAKLAAHPTLGSAVS